ncbi:WUSCHEL-related homeobox 13-like isoform X2 [Cicer arietinum]|uniref:WUSCHEL-related homeobox 13-like isoform X2 n=1 Tax=Cicer arietinum TaxID=3827 RepID=A0A1S2XNI3_CICAR|nr:WUSCHEL-related homeobox 13-like isoform X2 [Cicer arietinum]
MRTSQLPIMKGARLGGMYCDQLMGSGGHKISSRQRWTPTPLQLQILERIFEAGTGTPSKEKIKEITADLSKHGQISETNVYNWFQNRRARSKRKQQNAAPSSVNAESEVENEVDSNNNKIILDEFVVPQPAENLSFQNPQVCSDLQYFNPESDDSLRLARNFDHEPVFDGMLSNSRSSDYLTGKIETSESFNLYQSAGDYGMEG